MARPDRQLYHGAENPLVPDAGGRLPTALVFPGARGPALSTLGWQAVYRLLAASDDLAVERFFVTGKDEPVSADTGRPLSYFPVVAVSMNVEEDLPALLATFTVGGVPPRRAERPRFPLVIVGGPLAFLNPAPLSPMADLFWVGEAEAGLTGLLADIKADIFDGLEKPDILEKIKNRPGVYAPGWSNTPVKRIIAPGPGLPEPAFSCFTGPEAVFKDSLLLEVNRGCPYGCRFCAAGFVYRPPRQADPEELKRIVELADPPKVGLVGTALTDWPPLLDFLKWLHARKVKFSLSSVRADGLTEELVGFLRQVGVRTITLALEGPSRRIRDMASKKLEEADFLKAVALCASHGVNHLRIYLITGWPGETDEDYEELEQFIEDTVSTRDANLRRKKEFMRLTLSASCLSPKPFTPFQWMAMAPEDDLERRVAQLKKIVKKHKGLTLSPDKPSRARLQSLLARGDESLFDLAELAADMGWKRALREWDGDPAWFLDRERDEDEPFPWEVVDVGVERAHLWKEWQRARRGKNSPGCPDKGCHACRACGVQNMIDY